jgi:hypothetical protein
MGSLLASSPNESFNLHCPPISIRGYQDIFVTFYEHMSTTTSSATNTEVRARAISIDTMSGSEALSHLCHYYMTPLCGLFVVLLTCRFDVQVIARQFITRGHLVCCLTNVPTTPDACGKRMWQFDNLASHFHSVVLRPDLHLFFELAREYSFWS